MSNIKIQSEYSDLDKYKNIFETIFYYKKGTSINHNPYGPAIICKDGAKYYCLNNKRHRLDGPAVIYSDSEKQYYINNKQLTKEEFEIHPERLKFLGKGYLICLK